MWESTFLHFNKNGFIRLKIYIDLRQEIVWSRKGCGLTRDCSYLPIWKLNRMRSDACFLEPRFFLCGCQNLVKIQLINAKLFQLNLDAGSGARDVGS